MNVQQLVRNQPVNKLEADEQRLLAMEAQFNAVDGLEMSTENTRDRWWIVLTLLRSSRTQKNEMWLMLVGTWMDQEDNHG